MSGVSAKCYGTKWHRRRGSHRNDVDDQKSRHTKPSCRANVRASDRVFGLWFVFARGSYARPPVSVALPTEKSERFQRKSEKSKCLFYTLIRLFHGHLFDCIVPFLSFTSHLLSLCSSSLQ